MNALLETPRLRLRQLETVDLDFVAAMMGDAEVMRHYPEPLDRAEAAAWLERQLARYAEDGHGLWLVELRSNGEPIGQIGLIRQIVEGAPEREIGWLLHRPLWGRGYATEAAAAVRDLAFTTWDRPYVISLIRPINVPSQAVARRKCQAVDAAARKGIEEGGFGPRYKHLTHRLGHGIGVDGHEWPYMVRGSTTRLAAGMTFTDEPGIYIPGELGIRHEDTVAVTEKGCENLCPKWSGSPEDPTGVERATSAHPGC